MSIIEQISKANQKVQERVAPYRQAAVAVAQESARRAAAGVVRAKAPVQSLAEAGQRFTGLTHRYFEQLIGHQAALLADVIDGGAAQLELVAEASELRALVKAQRKAWAASRGKVGRELASSWQVIANTGRELRELATETYAQVAHGGRIIKTPKKTARRAGRKARATRKAARVLN